MQENKRNEKTQNVCGTGKLTRLTTSETPILQKTIFYKSGPVKNAKG